MMLTVLHRPRAELSCKRFFDSRRFHHTLEFIIFILHTIVTRFRARHPIVARTSGRTRSQKSADEEHRTPKFRDWLEAGGDNFVQQKPQANLQNLWENEISTSASRKRLGAQKWACFSPPCAPLS